MWRLRPWRRLPGSKPRGPPASVVEAVWLSMTPARRLRLTAKFPARPPDQGLDDSLPSAGVAPSVKIALHRGVRRKFLRQGPPLAPGGQDVEDRLHGLAQIDFPRASQPTSRRHLPGDHRPLRIGQIACVAQPIALILDASDFGPRHRALPRIFANPKESQPTEITHSFFGRGLRRGPAPRLEGCRPVGGLMVRDGASRLLTMRRKF